MKVNNLIVVCVLFFIFTTLFIGASMRENADEDFNIYNLTNSINSSIGCQEVFDVQKNLTNVEINVNEIKSQRLNRMVCVFNQAVVTLSIEASLFAVEYGYEHPENDYGAIISVLKILIVLMIISALIPIIIPLLAIIYLIGLGIVTMLGRYRNGKSKD